MIATNKINLGAVYTKKGRSSNTDHPSIIFFLYSVYIQKIVLGPNAGIFLKIGSYYLRDRKILAPGKLNSLGRS